MKILVAVLLNTVIFLFLYGIILGFLKQIKKNSAVVFDFDAMVDMSTIKARAELYAQNKDGVTVEDYINAHVSEQVAVPSAIKNAIIVQQLGYKLIFISTRLEHLRPQTADLLNKWGLRGDLYMNEGGASPLIYKYSMLQYLKTKYKVIDFYSLDEPIIMTAIKSGKLDTIQQKMYS